MTVVNQDLYQRIQWARSQPGITEDILRDRVKRQFGVNIDEVVPAESKGLLKTIGEEFIKTPVRYAQYLGEAAHRYGHQMDPAFRYLNAKSSSGKTLNQDEAQKFQELSKEVSTTKFIKPEETTWQEGLKRTAGMASYAMPIGGNFGAATVLGGITGGLYGAGQEKADWKSILKSAGLGAVTGGGMYAGGKLVGKISEGLKGVGEGTRSSILNPQAEANPFYTQNIQELEQAQKNLGLAGSAKGQMRQIGEKFNELSSQIKSILGSPVGNTGKPINLQIKSIIKTIDDDLSDSIFYLPEESAYKNARDKIIGQIKKTTEAGTTPITNLNTYRESLGRQLKSVWKADKKGLALTPQQEVGKSIYNSIRKIIGSEFKDVSPLLEQQHAINLLSTGLKERIEQNVPISSLLPGLSAPNQPIQAIGDFAGRGMSSFGGALQKISSPTTAGDLLTKVATLTAGATPTRELSTKPTQFNLPATKLPTAAPQQANAPAISQQQMSLIMLTDLIESGGKNIPELQTIFNMMKPQDKLSDTARLSRSYGENGLSNMQKAKDSFGIQDWSQLPTERIVEMTLPGGLGTRKELAFLKTALMNYAYAQSGKQMSWQEVKMQYGNFLPQWGDSVETARAKIQNLDDGLKTILQISQY